MTTKISIFEEKTSSRQNALEIINAYDISSGHRPRQILEIVLMEMLLKDPNRYNVTEIEINETESKHQSDRVVLNQVILDTSSSKCPQHSSNKKQKVIKKSFVEKDLVKENLATPSKKRSRKINIACKRSTTA